MSVHITHKWVDIKDLEIFATKEARSLLQHIKRATFVDEVVFLKTCNRLEMYIASSDPSKVSLGLDRMMSSVGHGTVSDYTRVYGGESTVRHLFRVAAGVDSMVVGEDQILGQVQSALAFARQEGTTGPTLTSLFEKAIKVGQKVRTETEINKGAVSVGSIAVDKAERELGGLDGKTILVLGAGEMASSVSKSLCSRSLKAVMVANRTYEAAKELASSLGGEAVHYDKLPEYGRMADIIICATSAPHVILTKDEIARIRTGVKEPLMIIDISHPVNIDPRAGELANVRLITLDGLREISRENQMRRKSEIAKVEDIIEKELRIFLSKYKEKDAMFVVKQLHELGKDLRDKEIDKALNKLQECKCARAEDMRSVLMDLSNSLISKMLAIPTISLKAASRDGDSNTMDAAVRLFNLKGIEKRDDQGIAEGNGAARPEGSHEEATKAQDE